MIIADANLLLYAYAQDAACHQAARAWLERMLSSGELLGLSWVVVQAFIRISTNSRARTQPLTMAEATAVVDTWVALDNVQLVRPGDRHWRIFRDLLREGQCGSALVTDAHLAALAVENGALLCSTDRDFSRFPRLRWTNPLMSAGPSAA